MDALSMGGHGCACPLEHVPIALVGTQCAIALVAPYPADRQDGPRAARDRQGGSGSTIYRLVNSLPGTSQLAKSGCQPQYRP